MSQEFVGTIILEWDGKEIDCFSVNTETNTGKRIVKVMSRRPGAAGHAKGVPDHKLSVEVPIPNDGSEADWDSLENAKLSLVPEDGAAKREVYLGCELESYTSKYQVEEVAMRALNLTALQKMRV